MDDIFKNSRIVDFSTTKFIAYGIFHQWGDSTVDDATVNVGIIEAIQLIEGHTEEDAKYFELGQIHTILPDCIRFLHGEELEKVKGELMGINVHKEPTVTTNQINRVWEQIRRIDMIKCVWFTSKSSVVINPKTKIIVGDDDEGHLVPIETFHTTEYGLEKDLGKLASDNNANTLIVHLTKDNEDGIIDTRLHGDQEGKIKIRIALI